MPRCASWGLPLRIWIASRIRSTARDGSIPYVQPVAFCSISPAAPFHPHYYDRSLTHSLAVLPDMEQATTRINGRRYSMPTHSRDLKKRVSLTR